MIRMEMEAEDSIRSAVLRKSENSGTGIGLGFSVIGGSGYDFPPVVHGIEKDSPAALSGLSAGDLILSINEREVVKLSTKEVLKCLRLSGNIVHIKFRRDPGIVTRVRQYLSQSHNSNSTSTTEDRNFSSPQKAKVGSQIPRYLNNSVCQSNRTHPAPEPINTRPNIDEVDRKAFQQSSFNNEVFINHTFQNTPSSRQNGGKKFETYLMTGDVMLNVTSTRPEKVEMPVPITPPRVGVGTENVSPGKITTTNTTTASPNPHFPHLPVVVERDKDQDRRLMLEKERKKADSPSPPPPPPPALNTNISFDASQGSGSDGLPPPPELEQSSAASGKRLLSGGTVTNGNGNGAHKNDNANNEDTSISSSVMTDSGDEIANGEDEDVKKLVGNSPLKKKKKNESGSGDGDNNESERYNEYVLLNGSSGTLVEEQPHNRTTAIIGGGDSKCPHRDGSDGEDVDSSSSSESSDNFPSDPYKMGSHLQQYQHMHNESGGESDSSDVESVRVAPVTKAIDVPSAERLAKRLYQLDGFKNNDVWRHLSKPCEFNRVVASEYLKLFEFKGESLDVSLRGFLLKLKLGGETAERERILSYFSTRWVECNPQAAFGSQDSIHTLVCAAMLLNTDLHAPGITRRMKLEEFVENLSGLNDGIDFPRHVLQQLYQSIRDHPLVSPIEEDDDSLRDVASVNSTISNNSQCTEFKRGYLVRKCTHVAGKRTPFGKRRWKLYFCRLQELKLVLTNDIRDDANATQNTISIKLHHAIATPASDYTKRTNVFRVVCSDSSQYLFQCSDRIEMVNWVDTINWNCSRYSSPAMEAPCSSSKEALRPLLPSSVTRMSIIDQINCHRTALDQLEKDLSSLAESKVKKSNLSKSDKEKLSYLKMEMTRYRIYLDVLDKSGNGVENGGNRNRMDVVVSGEGNSESSAIR